MLQYNECWYGSARPSMIMPIFSSYLFTRGGYMIEVYIANSNWLLLTLSLRQGVQCQATGNWPLSIDRSIDLRVENRRWVWGKSLLQKQWYSAVCVSSGEWWPYPALLVPPTISCSSLGVGATTLVVRGWWGEVNALQEGYKSVGPYEDWRRSVPLCVVSCSLVSAILPV